MRIFLFLLLFSAEVFGQAADGNCTEATITNPAGDGDYQCDSLIIGAGVHVIPVPGAPVTQHLRIDVLGDVTIDANATIVLSGGDGSPATGATPGGVAGFGGSDGGDNGAGGPNDAPDPPNGGVQGTSDAGTPCGAGGGGGGMATNGTSGTNCAVAGGLRGDAYTLLAVTFRGGFGGGAGGSASAILPITSATGGGGGGAIWISATGNITIDGDIDVSGGDGGSAPGASDSGGGGGGSGGAIRITSSGGQIVQNGTFILAAGGGGSGDGNGRSGGAGSDGIFEMSDADNVIFGVGTGANGLAPGSSNVESFKSSITCGAVKNKNDHQMYQVVVGFMLIVLISRIRGLFRRSA